MIQPREICITKFPNSNISSVTYKFTFRSSVSVNLGWDKCSLPCHYVFLTVDIHLSFLSLHDCRRLCLCTSSSPFSPDEESCNRLSKVQVSSQSSASADLSLHALRKSSNIFGNYCNIYNLALQNNFVGSWGMWKGRARHELIQHWQLLTTDASFPTFWNYCTASDVIDSNMKSNMWSQAGALPNDGQGRNKEEGRKWKVP